MALRWRGVDDIAVFDLSRMRRERALSLGATSAWDPREHPPADALGELRGHGQLWGKQYPKTDVYIEASGAPGLLPQIAELCNKQSRIVTLAIHRQPVIFDGTKLMSKEISVIGSSGYADEFPEVMQKLASGAVDLELLVSHRFPLSAFFDAFETASNPNVAAKVLLELDP
jgi:threonine dehydrogenase-like Zn-dependent dehydrogenase